MARLESPIRKVAIVFVKQVSEGKERYIREPYNIVELNYGDGSDIKTYMEPTCGRALAPSERAEVYDEIRVYDVPPHNNVRIGYAR